jgi:hypothetical protein
MALCRPSILDVPQKSVVEADFDVYMSTVGAMAGDRLFSASVSLSLNVRTPQCPNIERSGRHTALIVN